MISLWTVRTGVLVDKGVAYFGAGVFPGEGLYLYADGTPVTGNRVFDNSTGITSSLSDWESLIIRNNLIYDNSGDGLHIKGGRGHLILNNTIYELSGDAIEVETNAQDVELGNNILVAGDGYAIRVDRTSQIGFNSDYNLFNTTGTGQVGYWQDMPR